MKTPMLKPAGVLSGNLSRGNILWMTALALFAAAALPSFAQTVTMKANPLRFTVPFGATSSNAATVTIVTAGLVEANGDVVNFAVTGLPSGASGSFGTNSIYSNGTFTVTLIIETTAALAQGTYDVAIAGTGTANYRLPVPLICSYLWSGSTYTNGGSANLTVSGNWVGGVLPGATDNVVFGNSGGTTNVSAGASTNLIIAANKEFASLRFAQDQVGARSSYNVEFQGGAKLVLSGSGGYSHLRDAKVPLASGSQSVRMFGPGSLIVSNTSANFAFLVDGQLQTTLDLRELDYMYVDVNRVPLGDYRAYPNFFTNGWTGGGTGNEVSRFYPDIYLARTNVIKASFVDPNNYEHPDTRDYSLTIGNYSQQGTTQNLRYQLGRSNAFFLDSICFAQALQGASGHNFNFQTTNSTALFRGPGGLGSRMSVFAIGDAASPAPPGNANCRGQVNFANQTGCSVDVLADRLWISLDRSNNNAQMTVQANLTFGAGTIDVNSSVLGFQRTGNNQGSPSSTGFAGPEGTINVNSNASSAGALFRVNRDLHLGYTTASAPGGTTSAERTWGRVNINGGTVLASNIVCGGVTKLSTNNQIVMSSGKLVVTNAIGAADARLALFSLGGSPEVTLLGVAAGKTNIFVNNFSAVTAGGIKYIKIPSIAGVGAYPVTVPLISYTSVASPVFNGMYIIPPAGSYVKSIVDNTLDKTIDVTFTDEPPIVIVWRGYTNNVWDLSTRNWVTQTGGVVTNYSDGFSVVFDNTVGAGPTSIDIPAAVTPGQVAAANGIVVNNQSYNFNTGTLLGNSTLRKTGTGNLTINANFSPGVTMASGALSGTGTLGPTILEPGTTMTGFNGTIIGGLTASNATVTVSGPVFGGLVLQGGSLVNNNTINGSFNLAEGTTLDNRITGTLNVTLPWTIRTNSTLINNGTIYHFGSAGGNQGMTVNGLLKGVGKIIQDGFQASSDVRVTMGAGGSLMIGNSANEITNVTIAVRLDFNNTSTTTFDVNNTGTPVNDRIILNATPNGFGKVNFGAGNNLGGTLLVNKTAGPAFNGSTVLNFFDQVFNSPDNAQPAVPQVIPAPGGGLVWDAQEMLTNLTLRVMGPPMMTNFVSLTTNGSVNLAFEWPANYRGWRLERQTNALNVGLEQDSTNWTTEFTVLGGTNVLYYPDITNAPDVYWIRSVQTVSTTNSGVVAPTVFYRLNYP